MRSFLLASFALSLTWGLSGCDTPAEPKKDVPPPAASGPVDPPKVEPKMEPKKEEPKMEPAPAPVTPPETKPEPPK